MKARDHRRSFAVGLLALWLVLAGGAFAATKLKKDSVGSKQIKDGQVTNVDLGASAVTSDKVKDNSLTGEDIDEAELALPPSEGGAPSGPAGGDLQGSYPNPQLADLAVSLAKLSFDPATQAELDSHGGSAAHDGRYYTESELSSSDGNPPNTGSNLLHWNNLTGVPAGFADGTDDGGALSGTAGGDLTGTYPNPQITGGAVTIPKLAFDPATQGELDALASPGTINQASNPVDWTKLKGVPAGFADETDANSGGTVTSVGSGTGLTGGPITGSGSLSLATTFALPQGCGPSQVPKFDGSAWICATDANTGANSWQLGGNAGTDPATDFLGTTNNVALNLRVNNQRALRIEPNFAAPNLIGGFSGNSVNAGVAGATIAGGGASGEENIVTGTAGTVGGGARNKAASYSVVGGGNLNSATNPNATVGGGFLNNATALTSTVGGGQVNTAGGSSSTVSGGSTNTANGDWATVAGGAGNTAAGDYSFAVGRRATNTDVAHDGVFLFADSANNDFTSTAANEFAVRASGGFRLRTSSDLSTGCDLPAGSGTFACTSDREAKRSFGPVSPGNVLTQIARLPIESWIYKTDPKKVRHIGPTAQAFQRTFGIGEDPRTISSVDADGIALAAIKGLNARLRLQRDRIAELELIVADGEVEDERQH